MPTPPPRMLQPVEEPIAAEPAEPAEPAPAPATASRRPTRRTTTEPEAKPEPPPPAEAPTPPPAATADARPAAEPSRTLRAPGRDSAEKPIRDRLSVAQRDLSRVDYARLSQDGRTQYEQSKRFILQAEQALKDQNLVFAATLADKAATLAGGLLGR